MGRGGSGSGVQIMMQDDAATAHKAANGAEPGSRAKLPPIGVPQPPNSSVADRLDELVRAISAAADIFENGQGSHRSGSSFPSAMHATDIPPRLEEGWRLVRAFVTIRDSARRQAVLSLVDELARMDKS